MDDKRYLVDATDQCAYDTSYTPSPYDGSMDQGSPPSKNVVYPTQGQGMQSIGVDIDSSVQANSMNREDGMPPTYMLQNTLVLIFCSCTIGIIGLMRGNKVSTLYLDGDTSAAEAASKEARKWCRIGIVVGCFVKAFLLVYLIAYILSMNNNE